jgi:hypothetical protein
VSSQPFTTPSTRMTRDDLIDQPFTPRAGAEMPDIEFEGISQQIAE